VKRLTLLCLLFVATVVTAPPTASAGVGHCDTWGFRRCIEVCYQMEYRCNQAERDGNHGFGSDHCYEEFATCEQGCQLQGGCMPFLAKPSPS